MRSYSGSDGEEAMARCPQCRGYGEITNDEGNQEICPFCNGSGMVTITRATQYVPQQKASNSQDSSNESTESFASTSTGEENQEEKDKPAKESANEPRAVCPQCGGLGQLLILRKHQRCPLCDGHGSVTSSTATRWSQSRKKSADDYRPSS